MKIIKQLPDYLFYKLLKRILVLIATIRYTEGSCG